MLERLLLIHVSRACLVTNTSELNVRECHYVMPLCNASMTYFIIDTVDKRGRKVKQSSTDDLRKYYDLNGKSVVLIVYY